MTAGVWITAIIVGGVVIICLAPVIWWATLTLRTVALEGGPLQKRVQRLEAELGELKEQITVLEGKQ